MLKDSNIRLLTPDDLEANVQLVANAYPAFRVQSPEDLERHRQRILKAMTEDDSVSFWGLFRQGKLVGSMRLHDFTMQMHTASIRACGVGMVAVDLLHKKEKVCKEMIQFFMAHFHAQGYAMALLYPFRPDFYKQMGFGFGTRQDLYRISPGAIPKGPGKDKVVFLGLQDKEAMYECYRRVMARTHGLMDKSAQELNNFFGSPALRVVACREEGKVTGYLAFEFRSAGRPEKFIYNDLVVKEFIYEDYQAMSQLLTFLNSQSDQVNRVVFSTQDPSFHHLFNDPRNGSENLHPPVYHEVAQSGVGIMYRVLNTTGIFMELAEHNFNGLDCRLKITVRDNFFPVNRGSVVVHFKQGKPSVILNGQYDAEIALDVADFSSLIMGSIDFNSLLVYGRADLSQAQWAETIDTLFRVKQPPRCLTSF